MYCGKPLVSGDGLTAAFALHPFKECINAVGSEVIKLKTVRGNMVLDLTVGKIFHKGITV